MSNLSGVVYLVVSKRTQGGYEGHRLLFEAFAKRPHTVQPGEHVIPVRVNVDSALLDRQSDMQYIEAKAPPVGGDPWLTARPC
jgi:hypothetical protein